MSSASKQSPTLEGERSDPSAAVPSRSRIGSGDRLVGISDRMVRWNLAALMLDVTFFSLGMAFLDQNAVLPLLLERLGASGPFIGAFAAVRFLVFSVFQV